MGLTTIDIDDDLLRAASEALGTSGLSATVNAALREVARAHALAGFDVARDVAGSQREIKGSRRVASTTFPRVGPLV